MPRRSSYSRPSSNSRSSRAYAAPPRSAPVQHPTTGVSRPGLFGGLMGTMFQGMAFGAGSEVAHQTIRGMTGGHGTGQVQQPIDQAQQTMQQQVTQTNPCTLENTNFIECLKFNSNDISACQTYLDSLKECEMRFKK